MAAFTVRVRVAVPELLVFVVSVAFTKKEREVVLVGVPVRSPEVLREKPVTGVVKVQV